MPAKRRAAINHRLVRGAKQARVVTPPPREVNGITIEPSATADVWMVGSSFMTRARQQLSPQRPELVPHKKILWLARGGLRWNDLDRVIDAQVEATRRSPSAVVIHLGSNDLGSTKTSQLLIDMETSIMRIQAHLPNTHVCFSGILQRRYWHSARDPRKVEKSRSKLNRRLANRLRDLPKFSFIPHPRIVATDRSWFQWEGIHLSCKGIVAFVKDIDHALVQIFK
ncbi:uncharacterized protein [Haliotis cracherodii]|uniref:uncharacterized protein n=1 Tax=Haliotis cracherodii TaxID=6455 RepID=UPI0039E907CD